jgi:ubiquinone/menaquinone biosynthesis C-methylase UbiE
MYATISDRKSQAKIQFNAVAADYDAGPGNFGYFGNRLAMAADIQPGQRVLDVACGRGAVLFPCAELAGQTGEAIGIDLSDKMVRATNSAAIERRIRTRALSMDAEHLDFADGTFDRVLCGFGVMFFPDQERALGEFRRVMKVDGRLAVSTWRVSQTSEIEAAMVALGMQLARQSGWITEPHELLKLLTATGFTNVSVREESHSFRYESVDEYWRQARGTGMRRMLDRFSAADVERIRAALTRRVSPDQRNHFRSTSAALIATASR